MQVCGMRPSCSRSVDNVLLLVLRVSTGGRSALPLSSEAEVAKTALISATTPRFASAAWAGQGCGLGPRRNWRAVSEKSRTRGGL